MRQLNVDLGERGYPILMGPKLIGRAKILADYLEVPHIALISDKNVAPLYANPLIAQLEKAGVKVTSAVVPSGERSKSNKMLEHIYSALIADRCDRKTTVVALGGGVVGDLAGFAAATYQRGVPFIQIPTTFLAQVDSAVGGKTGINHPLAKNMIGAFWQPSLVLSDIDTLKTLPLREFRSGFAEVVKYALICDKKFLIWLDKNLHRLMNHDPEALAFCVHRCCAIKVDIVTKDEKELGLRALLNFGHTFGHAIEAATNYGRWRHGEAISAGMVIALELSRRAGWVSAEDCKWVNHLLCRIGLPERAPKFSVSRYLELMTLDKKNQLGKLRLILLQGLGQGVIVSDAPASEISAAISACY